MWFCLVAIRATVYWNAQLASHIEHIQQLKLCNEDGGVSVFICTSDFYLPRENPMICSHVSSTVGTTDVYVYIYLGIQ